MPSSGVNFYSFDVMGDVGFSRSFGMVENGEEVEMIKLLHKSMEALSMFGHLTWGLNLAIRTAAGAKAMLEHTEWTAKVLKERSKVSVSENEAQGHANGSQITPKENDIFSWLLDPNATEISPELNADARLLVVAGRCVYDL